MAINTELKNRSNNACELCLKQDNQLHAYTIPPKSDALAANQAVLCTECFDQVKEQNYSNSHYWRFLEGSIWSEVPAVQVLSYKILSKITAESWASDAMESVYMDEENLAWAAAEDVLEEEKIVHKDSNGTVLQTGDTIILTQNLPVKGTGYIAPKGTIVRRIKLVSDNPDQIEGKINNDTIVILTKYVRKSI